MIGFFLFIYYIIKLEVDMFTQDEAEIFVKDLLENVFPKAQVERLEEFYSRDLLGHFNGSDFVFDDILDRINALSQSAKNIKFLVKNVVVFENFIAVTCQQNWMNKSDDHFHDSMVFAIYRIKDKKIVELWGLLEKETPSYQEVNKDYAKAMQAFNVTAKYKELFLQRLAIILSSMEDKVILSPAEQECLYYYIYGATAKETANYLNLSPRTVETYLAIVKNKFNCHTKQELRQLFFPEQTL